MGLLVPLVRRPVGFKLTNGVQPPPIYSRRDPAPQSNIPAYAPNIPFITFYHQDYSHYAFKSRLSSPRSITLRPDAIGPLLALCTIPQCQILHRQQNIRFKSY